MAKERWFTGFEDAGGLDLNTVTGFIIADANYPARTGDFFLSEYTPQGISTSQARRTLINTYTCANNLDKVIARMQFAYRSRMFPTSNGTAIGGFYIGTSVSPNQAAGILQNTNGAFGVITSNAGQAGTGVFLPQLGKWYVFRLHLEYQRVDAGNDPSTVQLQIFDGDTMDSSANPTPLETITRSFTGGIAGFLLNGIPCLGSNVAKVGVYDYDDWWISVADGVDANLVTNTDLAWPGGSRIQAVPIVAQSAAGWTGATTLVMDVPNSAVAGNEQTTTTPSATTTFTHQTAAELGLIPVGQAADENIPDVPPYSGAPWPDVLTSGAAATFRTVIDPTLPIPILASFTLTAGAGQFTSGVWVRPFTVDRNNTTGKIGPLGPAVFLSAGPAPNFAATIVVRFHPTTPVDHFDDPNNPSTAYHRYGLGLLVTNASNSSGLMNPTSNDLNIPTSITNTTNLNTYGGPGAIDAGLWGSLVALFSVVVPNGVLPPYDNTNPSIRPNEVTFLLSSPQPSGTAGSPTTTNLFGPVFQPPASTVITELPIAAAIKVIAPMQHASGTANENILIGGVAYPVSVNTSYSVPPTNGTYAIDWTPRDAEEFDALVFGAQASAALGTTLRLGSCIAEVLTAGPCTKRNTGYGQYQQQCGVYTSNAGVQTITLPFKPTCVFVKRIGTTASPGSVKAWWMGGTQSFPINTAAMNSVSIMKLLDDGFMVGPDNSANGVAATYAYVAMRDGQEDTVNDAYMVAGAYQRQGIGDALQITTLPLPLLFASSWVPDVIMHIGGGSLTVMKTSAMVVPNSDNFASTGLITTGITAVGDRQFTTGSSIVAFTSQHIYFAMKFDAGGLLATLFQEGSFAGTGGVQVIPTNFQGEVIVLDHPQAAYEGRWRSFLGNTGNNSNPWIGGNVTTADITAISATDFTVGANASVLGQTSYWLAWKRDGSIGNAGSTDLPPPGGGGGDPTDPPDGDICGGGGLKVTPGTLAGHGCTQC